VAALAAVLDFAFGFKLGLGGMSADGFVLEVVEFFAELHLVVGAFAAGEHENGVDFVRLKPHGGQRREGQVVAGFWIHGLARSGAGGAVIVVIDDAASRVVDEAGVPADYGVGLVSANGLDDEPADFLAVFEIAVGEFPKRNACDLEDFGGILLLGLAQNYQFLLRNVGVGCAIAAVGEDNVVYFGAGTYELGDGTAG